MKSSSLKENYQSKLQPADEAVRRIRSGQRVFIGSSCGEPQHLVNALMDNAKFFSDVEIVRMLSLEGSLMSLMADEYRGHKFHVRSIYQGSDQTKSLRANKRFITPLTLCAVPDLFKKGLLPLHFALIQVSPPDDNGWMSLGMRKRSSFNTEPWAICQEMKPWMIAPWKSSTWGSPGCGSNCMMP